MGASYTAVPAAVVETDYPDDWSIRWYFDDAFPGPPFPPGYDPEYSSGLSAPSDMYVGHAVFGISSTCTDRETFNTVEPSAVCSYTASLLSSGAPIQMRLDGGETWLNSVGGEYELDGSTWVNDPGGIEFNVSPDDDEDFIVLVADTQIAGTSVSDTVNIEIKVPPDITCTVTTVIDFTLVDPIPTDETWTTQTLITPDSYTPTFGQPNPPYAWAFYFDKDTPDSLDIDSEAYDIGFETWDVFKTRIEELRGDPWELGASAVKTHVLEGLDMFAPKRTYYVSTSHWKTEAANGTYVTTLKVYVDEELVATVVDSGSLPNGDGLTPYTPIWTINGETGVVTIL